MNNPRMDEYIANFTETRFLCLERAADEYIQITKELLSEATTTSDKCIDILFNGLTQEEIDEIIDSEPLEDLDYEDYDDEFDEMENDDVDVIIDLELDPDVIEIE